MAKRANVDEVSVVQEKAAARRVRKIAGHLRAASAGNDSIVKRPLARELAKWNGWGHESTRFVLNENGDVELTGARYAGAFSGGNRVFPALRPWVERVVGLDLSDHSPPFAEPPELAPPLMCNLFASELASNGIELVTRGLARLQHSHGHSELELT